MWLFDKRAFTSTVAYDPSKDRKDTEHKKIALASADPKSWLLIRARVKADLETVQEQMGTDIFIDEDKGADYSFRALVTRDSMKTYLAKQVDEIDYDSHFKEVVEKHATQGVARHTAMMRVWTAMAGLQPHAPYGGFVSTGGKTGSNWSAGKGFPALGAKTSAAPVAAVVPAFRPSTTWIDVAATVELLTGVPIEDVADEVVNAMDDDAFEVYLAARSTYGESHVLTESEMATIVDSLNDGSLSRAAAETDANSAI